MRINLLTYSQGKLTRIHWPLLGLVVLGAAVLLTTQSARQHVAASAAALLPQVQPRPRAPVREPLLSAPKAAAPPCGDAKKKEVLARATTSAPSVRIDCSLTLNSSDVITKQLIFEGASAESVGASGVTVECNGATIGTSNQSPKVDRIVDIHSKRNGPLSYKRPENITLRNCKIIGSVGVYGLTGEEMEVNRRPNYVTLSRDNAPRSIVFDHVTITGIREDYDTLYLFSGVSNFQLLDSEIKGIAGVNIYLDAESFGNTFRNNYIHATTKHRELLAIDASQRPD